MIFLCALAVCFVLFLFNKIKNYYDNHISLPPGPPGRFVLGVALEIIGRNIFHKLSEYANVYGDVFSVKLFHKNVVCLSSKDAVVHAFVKAPRGKNMNDRAYTFFGEYVFFGSQSVLQYRNSNCRIHSCMRKGIIKALHVYGKDGVSELEKMVQHEIRRLTSKIETVDCDDFDVVSAMQRSLTNLMASVISGEVFNDSDEDINNISDYIEGANYFLNQSVHTLLTCFPILRHCPGIFRGKYLRMLKARDKVIGRFFVNIKSGKVKRGVMGSLLAEQEKCIDERTDVVFTDERIACTVLELMSTGIQSISSLITSTLLCLIDDDTGYQDRVFEELDKVIGKNDLPSLSDIDKCPLLEALQLEIHRYVTIVPLLVPHVQSTEDVKFVGYDIPKQTLVVGNIWHAHHNDKVWRDPWNFRPQRFLDSNGRLLPIQHPARASLMPFGVGRRQCLGRSLTRAAYFLYMATLLRRWRFTGSVDKFEPCDPKHMNNFDTTTFPFIQPKPFHCRTERRYLYSD